MHPDRCLLYIDYMFFRPFLFLFLDGPEYFFFVFVENYTVYATDNVDLYEYTFSSPVVFSVIFWFSIMDLFFKNRLSDTVSEKCRNQSLSLNL